MNAMQATVERFLGMMRQYLRMANEYERSREIDMADEAGAIAAHFLERAIAAQDRPR